MFTNSSVQIKVTAKRKSVHDTRPQTPGEVINQPISTAEVQCNSLPCRNVSRNTPRPALRCSEKTEYLLGQKIVIYSLRSETVV
jgi:hypothetical protein